MIGYYGYFRYKLLQRHAKCQTELGNFGEAKAHFKVQLSNMLFNNANSTKKGS